MATVVLITEAAMVVLAVQVEAVEAVEAVVVDKMVPMVLHSR